MGTFSASLLSLLISVIGSHDSPKSTPTVPPIDKVDTVRKSLLIETETSYFPFASKNKNGELVGFEIDLMNALCDDMQVQCKIKDNTWDDLIPSLKAGKSDAIIAGMTITPERQAVVDFTQPYYRNDMVFIGKKTYPIKLNNTKLNANSVGVLSYTQEAEYLDKTYPNLNVKKYHISSELIDALKTDKIKLALLEKSFWESWLIDSQNQDYEVKESVKKDMNLAIAMRKGDPMIEKFNQSLANLKANGTYEKISQKYFKPTNVMTN